MYKISLLVLLATPALLYGSCVDYRKIHGLVDLKKKSWETTHVNKKAIQVCEALPLPARVNLEIIVVKGDKRFSTNIYRSLVGFWDNTDKDKNWTGGKYKLKQLDIETFVPDWYKDSVLTIKEISTQKNIVETKL